MSQAGPLNDEGTNPQAPTSFVTDSGTAIPLLNTIEILGGTGIITSGSGNVVTITATGSGEGTVTSVSVVSANGLAGTVANPTTTPSITLSTTVTGILSGNGTAISGSTITLHDVLVGGASNAITSISPSIAGFVLTSNGIGSDPSFQSISASGAATTFDGDSGVANPTALGVILISGGSTGLTTSAATSAVTLTGVLNLASGGTNANLTASNGGIFYSTASAGAILSGTATAKQMLQSGSSTTPAWSTSTWPATTTINQILYSSSANAVAGLATANDGVLITGTTGIPSILAAGTTGQVLTATTGFPPSWASPATSGTVTSVSVVSANGFAGTVANATTTPAITISTSITGVLSGNGTAISGSAITQYDVLIGAASNAISSVGPGTAGQILQSGGNAANPAYSTSTYPATNAINTLLYASSANVMSALATANQGVLTTGATGIPVITALATNGQLIIGSTAGVPAAATLTPGTGISITNGSNSITIASTGSSMAWTDEAVNFNGLAGNGYFATTTLTATMPASPSQGNTISFVMDSADNTLTIKANTGQFLRIGVAISSSAGTATNNAQGDSVTFVYRTADTTWIATSVIGIWSTA